MKQLFLVAALAVGAAGCADDLRPIQLRDAKPLDVECSEADVGLYAGSLDLAALDNGAPPQSISFLMSFTVASQMEAVGVQVGNGSVADAARNNFIVEEIEYSFTSTPPRAFAAERVPAFAVIPAATSSSRMNINLIPPRALETVMALVDETGAPVTLLSTIRLKGRLASGVQTESDTATFPITVYNSGIDCAALGGALQFTGACGNASGYNSVISCFPEGSGE